MKMFENFIASFFGCQLARFILAVCKAEKLDCRKVYIPEYESAAFMPTTLLRSRQRTIYSGQAHHRPKLPSNRNDLEIPTIGATPPLTVLQVESFLVTQLKLKCSQTDSCTQAVNLLLNNISFSFIHVTFTHISSHTVSQNMTSQEKSIVLPIDLLQLDDTLRPIDFPVRNLTPPPPSWHAHILYYTS